jgi:flavin reductase (DIM6/NTAB) family NADH-FMN oxidoreductase RutF
MKVPFPPDKNAWHPSLLPGQIVLVSTVDAEGLPNLAPKSWVTMVAFAGPIVAFGCNVNHATYRNVVATNEFVLNVLPELLAERTWALSDLHGRQRVRECGLTLAPAQKVRAPLVDDCPAHLECQLDDVKRYGLTVRLDALRVRALEEGDLGAADRIMRVAFGTFLGLPDPSTMFGDAEFVRTRFRAAPDCAWAAEVDGKVVGSVFAARWGTFGALGPLTTHPSVWDGGVGRRLLDPVIEAFDRWGLRQAGLFRFPDSPKHVGL